MRIGRIRRFDERLLADHPSAAWVVLPFAGFPLHLGVVQLTWCPFRGDTCSIGARALGVVSLMIGIAIVAGALHLGRHARRRRAD